MVESNNKGNILPRTNNQPLLELQRQETEYTDFTNIGSEMQLVTYNSSEYELKNTTVNQLEKQHLNDHLEQQLFCLQRRQQSGFIHDSTNELDISISKSLQKDGLQSDINSPVNSTQLQVCNSELYKHQGSQLMFQNTRQNYTKPVDYTEDAYINHINRTESSNSLELTIQTNYQSFNTTIDTQMIKDLSYNQRDKINCICYNQDQTLIGLGTKFGFYIYQLDQLILLTKQHQFEQIKQIYIPQLRNQVLLTSNSYDQQLKEKREGFQNQSQKEQPWIPSKEITTIIQWDYDKQNIVNEYSCLDSVNAIACSNNILIIVQNLHILCVSMNSKQKQLQVSNMSIGSGKMHQYDLIYSIDTLYNKSGIFGVSYERDFCLAAPNIILGHIVIHWFKYQQKEEQYRCNSKLIIDSNISGVSQIALNKEGDLVATTSVLGTIIRVFDTKNAVKIKEFRRGSIQTTIYNLYFDLNSDFLVCCSERQTIHIYKLKTVNTNSYFKPLKEYLPIAGDEWSFAQFSHKNMNQTDLIQTIIKNQILYVLGVDDSILMVQLTQQGGSLNVVSKSNLLYLT